MEDYKHLGGEPLALLVWVLKPTPAAPKGKGKRKGRIERTLFKNSSTRLASNQRKKGVAVPKTGRRKGGIGGPRGVS